MFDVQLKDLSRVPLTYAAITDADAFATKVKLNLAIPWLEVVCGRKTEEEIFLIADAREYHRFALSEKAQEIASIFCRALERKTGKLISVELSKVVALDDGISVRYGVIDGHLLDPLTLKRDARCEKNFLEVLFEVNTGLRRRRKRKDCSAVASVVMSNLDLHQS